MKRRQIFLESLKRYWYVLLIVPGLWLLAGYGNFLDTFEYATVNLRFKFRGEIESPIKLRYVDLDSQALEIMGERPLPRAFFAYAVEALYKYGNAEVVAIDAVFSETAHSTLVDETKVQRDTGIFRKVIEESPTLVLGAAYTPKVDDLADQSEGIKLTQFPYIHRGFTDPNTNSLPEQPEVSLIGLTGGNLGLINFADHYSPGAIPRWIPMFAKSPGPTYLTLSLEMARLKLGVEKDNVEIGEDEIHLTDIDGNTVMKVPLTANQLVEVNWFNRWLSDKNVRYSLKTVLGARSWIEGNDEEKVKRAQAFFKDFEDAFILIGPTDPLLHDLAPTPYENAPVPKVGVHGNLLKTLFSGKFLHRISFFWSSIITIGLTLLVIIFTIQEGRNSMIYKALALLSLIGYFGFCFFAFNWWDWVMPIVMPLGAAVSCALIVEMIQLIITENQRSRIKNMFGTYVSRDLVDHMVEEGTEPHLGGQEKEITALFSDIENFTSICEGLSPTAVIDLMNEYLTAMTDVIQEERGTLDKYIGDAIVAMFGAPVGYRRHALSSCRAACKMLKAQEELKKRWQADNKIGYTDAILNMRTRIGINTGLVTIGNMGSSVRFNYTMLGDDVNLAARCESAAKTYGIQTLVSESTQSLIEPSAGITFRELDNIVVKGKTQAVKICELVGFSKEVDSSMFKCIDLYEQGLKAYTEANWDEALDLFMQSLKYEQHVTRTNPSHLMIDRTKDLKERGITQDSWSGVYQMVTK